MLSINPCMISTDNTIIEQTTMHVQKVSLNIYTFKSQYNYNNTEVALIFIANYVDIIIYTEI